MTHNIARIAAKISAAATMLAMFAVVNPAVAAEIAPVTNSTGPWSVTTLAKDAGGVKIEAYKVDKNLAAWTEIDGNQRQIFAYDGTQIRLLAAFDKNDWKDDGNGFYETVNGNFDVADGIVTWTMSDGNDREIYSWGGDAVAKVSDNTYDDRHPITSAGRIAWTSQPSATQYNLMVKDSFGRRRLDAWPATNYAFSGSNLFWLNTRPNENWMHVIVNSGLATTAIGQADDRPMTKYFITDGKGSAAWEYSTKQWSYDKRIAYVSVGGARAIEMIQRDVPPMVTRLEDMDGGKLMVNVTDLLLTDLQHKSTLIEITNAYMSDSISRKEVPTKVRYMDGGYVRMREPGADTSMVFHNENGGEDFVTLDTVLQDRFDADGTAAAGARKNGGLVTRVDGQSVVIPSSVVAASLMVKNGNIAWIEGTPGSQTLKFATTTVLVANGKVGTKIAGRLVKSSAGSAVYFAAADGKRYVFGGEGTYFTWFKDFNTVQTLSAATIARMPLAGTVLYKPGTRLLKVASSPKVYQIGNDGRIYWVQSEEVLANAFGQYWKQSLAVIDEADLAQYPQGGSVSDTLTYYRFAMK